MRSKNPSKGRNASTALGSALSVPPAPWQRTQREAVISLMSDSKVGACGVFWTLQPPRPNVAVATDASRLMRKPFLLMTISQVVV